VLARVLRLFPPLVFGAVLLSPPLEILGTAGLRRSFPDFLLRSLQGFHGVTQGAGFAFDGFHLAYLLLLLVLSLTLLPLFLALRRSLAVPPRARTSAGSVALLLALSLLAPRVRPASGTTDIGTGDGPAPLRSEQARGRGPGILSPGPRRERGTACRDRDRAFPALSHRTEPRREALESAALPLWPGAGRSFLACGGRLRAGGVVLREHGPHHVRRNLQADRAGLEWKHLPRGLLRRSGESRGTNPAALQG